MWHVGVAMIVLLLEVCVGDTMVISGGGCADTVIANYLQSKVTHLGPPLCSFELSFSFSVRGTFKK